MQHFCESIEMNNSSYQESHECTPSNGSINDLQRQLRDALDKNSRWQSYNWEREQYVRNLLAKYNQTSSELQNVRKKLVKITSNPDQLAVEQRRYFDNLLVDARLELDNQRNQTLRVETEMSVFKEKYEKQIECLQKDLQEWKEKCNKYSNVSTTNLNDKLRNMSSSDYADELSRKNVQYQLSEKKRFEEHEANRTIKREVTKLKQKVDLLQENLKLHEKKSLIADSDVLIRNFGLDRCTMEKVTGRHKQHNNDEALYEVENELGRYGKHNATVGDCDILRDKPRSIEGTKARTFRASLTDACTPTKNRHKGSEICSNKPNKMPAAEYYSTTVKSSAESYLPCPICGKKYSISQHVSLLAHIDICDD